jgi:hypothetical protein
MASNCRPASCARGPVRRPVSVREQPIEHVVHLLDVAGIGLHQGRDLREDLGPPVFHRPVLARDIIQSTSSRHRR